MNERQRKQLDDWHDKQIKEHGWYMHYVIDNHHTHHVAESFKHPDFQIVMNMPANVIGGLFTNLVDRVKAGEQFALNQVVEGIAAKDYKVKLVGAEENGRPVLRVIIPEANGNLDEDKMTPDYRRQYDGVLSVIEFLAFIPNGLETFDEVVKKTVERTLKENP
jgi:hypothetical protein